MKNLWYINREDSSPALPASLWKEAAESGVSVRTFTGCEPVLACLSEGTTAEETLFLTDSPDFAKIASRKHLPTVGYEHGGVRLSCPEIILSLRSLTLAECVSLYDSLTGRTPLYADDAFVFLPIDEETFVQYYDQFCDEPYFLTETDKQRGESSIRLLWENRRVLSALSEGFGPAEVFLKSDIAAADKTAEPIGYAAAFAEHFDGLEKPVLQIEYYIRPEFRGRHLAVPMVGSLLSALNQMLPGKPVYAKVHPENAPSLAVLDRLGFADVPLGRAKEYRLKVARQPVHCKP